MYYFKSSLSKSVYYITLIGNFQFSLKSYTFETIASAWSTCEALKHTSYLRIPTLLGYDSMVKQVTNNGFGGKRRAMK